MAEKLKSAEQRIYQVKQHYLRFSELRQEIYSHPEREWTTEQCASQMYMSRSYFLNEKQQVFSLLLFRVTCNFNSLLKAFRYLSLTD